MLTCRPTTLIRAGLFFAVGAVGTATFSADIVAPNGARQPPDPDDGQWLRAAKNFASTRFSALTQINTGNVKDLKVAWTFSTGAARGHEAAPIIAGSTMYVVTPFPNILYA